jgi:hypothetical protein
MRPEVRSTLNNRKVSDNTEWLTREQVSDLFGLSYDIIGDIPVGEVPRLKAGKSHLFYRAAITPFLLKAAASGINFKAYCKQGEAAPHARKRGRPPKRLTQKGLSDFSYL